MKVKELIEKLQTFDPELPVALVDFIHIVGGIIEEVDEVSLEDAEEWKKNLYAKIYHSDIDGKFVTIK